MKKAIIYIGAAFAAILSLALTGCETGDGDREYGYAYVMMPQSQRLEGYYPVPGGSEEFTRNFRVENGNVLVFMGVMRSGKVANKAFSVDIVTNDTAVGDFIYDGIVPGSEQMPEELYTLPEKVDVASDDNDAQFYLELSGEELMKPALDGKNLLLCVELANPTQFKLSRDTFRTMVVVDVDAIRTFL